MQITSYDQLVRLTTQLLGEDATMLDAQRWNEVREAVSQTLERWWTHAWWPGLMRVEQRPLRIPYDSAVTYADGTEVWHAPSERYYHAMQEALGEAPADLVSGEWITNVEFWAESRFGYSADEYDAATAYVAGDQVFRPEDGLYYQAHSATTGNAPTDTDFWGLLKDFIPSLPRVMDGYNDIGHVRAMYPQDPRRLAAAEKLDFTETHDAWLLHDVGCPLPWVEYRLRCPVLEGAAFSATASYVPADDDTQVEDTVPIITDSRLFREFTTVADLIAADSATFRFAHCFNFEGTDGINSTWVRTAEPGLVDNNGDIRQMDDGAFVRRTYTDP